MLLSSYPLRQLWTKRRRGKEPSIGTHPRRRDGCRRRRDGPRRVKPERVRGFFRWKAGRGARERPAQKRPKALARPRPPAVGTKREAGRSRGVQLCSAKRSDLNPSHRTNCSSTPFSFTSSISISGTRTTSRTLLTSSSSSSLPTLTHSLYFRPGILVHATTFTFLLWVPTPPATPSSLNHHEVIHLSRSHLRYPPGGFVRPRPRYWVIFFIGRSQPRSEA